MDNNGIVGEISKTNIERLIGSKFNQISMNGAADSLNIYNVLKKCSKNSSSEIEKEKIEMLKLIGDGQFGLVYLVRYKQQYFALKFIAKAQIISRRFEEYLINEKLIQSSLKDFPFLARFYGSFKDDDFVYLLQEYVNGKELSSILYAIQKKPFTCQIARFYIGQLILTFEYLHSKNIIHRDIKLNNIMVDQFGYIKLIDFGISKILNGNRTYSIIGTPHYMSPEVIMGKGYDYSADYWALGICLYEMLFWRLPFGDNLEDPLEVYNHIASCNQPLFDKKSIKELSEGTIDFINRLLNKDIKKRYNKSNIKEIKEHYWFHSFEWNELLTKKMSSFHIGKEQDLEKMKGKKLNEYIQSEEIKGYLKEYEKKQSKIANWDEFF